MTTQDKREYLYRYKALEGVISRKQDERDKLRTLCEKATTALSDAPRGGVSSREDMYIKLAEVEEELRGLYNQRARLSVKILQSFSSLNNKTIFVMLTCKYIWGMSEREIARKFKKSQSYVRTVHDKALKKLILDIDE